VAAGGLGGGWLGSAVPLPASEYGERRLLRSDRDRGRIFVLARRCFGKGSGRVDADEPSSCDVPDAGRTKSSVERDDGACEPAVLRKHDRGTICDDDCGLRKTGRADYLR